MCAAGGWGINNGDFRWGANPSGEWNLGSNWTWKYVLGYDSSDDYPGKDGDNNNEVYLNTTTAATNNNITITLTTDIEIANLYLETSGSHPNITINLNGHTLSIANNVYIGNKDQSSSDIVNFTITGNGTITADFLHIATTSTGSTVNISGEYTRLIVRNSINNSAADKSKAGFTLIGDGNFDYNGGSQVGNFVAIDSADLNVHINNSAASLYTLTEFKWIVSKNAPATTDREWTTISNWQQKKTNGTTTVYVAAARYPGSKNGDTAVFDAGQSAINLTLAEAGLTLNIKSTITGQGSGEATRATITGVGANADTATINSEGTWTLGKCNFKTLNVDGATTDTVRLWYSLTLKNLNITKGELYANSASIAISDSLTVTENGKINSYSTLTVDKSTVNNGTLDCGTGTSTFNGGYSGSGTTTLSSGTITFGTGKTNTVANLTVTGDGTITFGTGTTNTVENLTVSGAGTIKSLSENAVELVNVTLPTASGINVTFTGNFKSTGSFTAAADKTFFVNGNVDFSGCPSFTPTTNGAFLFYNTGSSVKTLKTMSDMPFRNFFFGGNVEIVLNGTVTVSAKCQMLTEDSAYNQSNNFTAKLSGGELLANAPAGSFVIKNMGASLGTLELAPSAKITCADTFYQETGTKLIIDAKDSNIGTDTVLTAKSYIGVENSSIENAGVIELTGGSSSFKFGSYTGSGDNSVKICGGSIECLAPANSGPIGKLLLLPVSDSSESLTTISSSDDFKVAKLVIGDNATLKALVNLAVSEQWQNNNTTSSSPFDANGKTVTFKSESGGESIKIVGNTTFGKVVFKSKTEFSDSCTFSDFVCETGGITLDFGTLQKNQTVTGNLTLSGSSGNPLKLDGSGKIVVQGGNSSFEGKFLLIGSGVQISQSGTPMARTFEAKKSYAAVATDYDAVCNNGWKLLGSGIYEWTGSVSTDWETVGNWKVLNEDNSYTSPPPDYPRYDTDCVTIAVASENQPVLGSNIQIAKITIGETSSLNLSGHNFTIKGLDGEAEAFKNEGKIILNGQETVEILSASEDPTLADKVNESGTWHYDASGGTVKKIPNLPYNKLIISGSSISIEAGYTVTAVNGITLGTGASGENTTIFGNVRFGSPVTLKNNVSLGGGGPYSDNTILLGDSVNGAAALSIRGNYIFFSKDIGSETPLKSIVCNMGANSDSGEFNYSLSVDGVTVKTSGDQTYNGYVHLRGTDGELTPSSTTSFISENGNILFADKIVNDSRTGAENHTLYAEAKKTITFAKSVGERVSNTLAAVSVEANEINIQSSVKTKGTQTYKCRSGNVKINGTETSSTFTSFSDNKIIFEPGAAIDSAKTFTLGSNLQITGNIENNGTFSAGGYSLVLQGTSENLSKITGTGQFVVTPVTNFTGEYLKIGSAVKICETADSVVNGAFDLRKSDGTCTSVPSAGTTDDDYAVLFKNGWKLKNLSFVWIGVKPPSWFDSANWNLGDVPGISSNEDVDVIIPDDSHALGFWPVVSTTDLAANGATEIKIHALNVGSVADSKARLTIEDDGTGTGLLNVTTTLVNYGTIEYKGDYRIYSGTKNNPINDIAHNGWIEYSGGSTTNSQIVTDFPGSGDDYANLLITGLNTETQAEISVAGDVRVWRKYDPDETVVNYNDFASLQIKKDLTLKGDFTLDKNCKTQAETNTNIIFAGNNKSFVISSPGETRKAGRAEFWNLKINSGCNVQTSGSYVLNGSILNENTDGSGFEAVFGTVTFQGSNVTVEGINTFDSAVFSKANAQIEITNANTFNNLIFKGKGSTVKFAAGETQKILAPALANAILDGTSQSLTDSFIVIGDATSKISLTTNAPSPSSTDTSTWWTIDVPADKVDVSNALISYSVSMNDISERIEDATKVNAEPDTAIFTTTNWFKRLFYWRGGGDSGVSYTNSWADSQNWKFKSGSAYYPATVPNDGSVPGMELSQIVIDTVSGGKNLVLEKDISVKSIKINNGKILDFAGWSVTANDSDDTTNDFIAENNSTLRFAGSGSEAAAATQSTITGSMDFGTGVTFEYYGGGKVSAVGGSSIPTRQILKITNASDGTRTHLQLGERDIQIQTASGANFNEGIIEVNDVGRISFSSTSFSMAKGLVIYTAPATSASGDLFPRAKFYNLQIGGGAWLIPNGLICENFYFTAGTLSILSDMITFTVNKNFVVFGSLYDSDDKDWLVSPNTRFAYPDSTADFINPTSYSAVFGTLAGTITVGGNFYVNGTNLNSGAFNLNLPAKTAAPVLNTTDAATSTMWGAPYAVVFNSTVSNCMANNWVGAASESKDSAGNVLFHHQNVTDGGGNTKFQFKSVEIEKAYSVSDSVICLEMNVPIKSLGQTSGADITNTEHISYNSKSNTFTGIFADPNCTQPVTTITDDTVKCYLKGNTNWNSDATATYAGGEDSTDYSGNRNPANIKTDISVLEGILFMLDGYTMSANYLAIKAFTATEDHAPPVLVSVYTGQEEHVKGAANQKTYDAHNFIEFKYSEPVSIGDFAFNETDESKLNNIQAQAAFDSDSSHGGAITNETSGFKVEGFGTFAAGKVVAGYKTGSAGSSDTAKPHALYRRFSLSSGGAETFYPCRIRLGIAAFVDGTVDSFNNWPGYIDSAVCPTGTFTVQANAFIKDESGNSLGATNADGSLKTLTVKNTASITNELYGSWDCLPPVFAPYLEKLADWNSAGTSTETRTYEIVGTVDSNTSSCINRIEIHLFDNEPAFDDSDALKWVSKKGWYDHSSYSYIDAPDMRGGVRYSSLSGSSAAFSYKYKVGSVQSDDRNFGTEFYQNVKSSLFSASTEAVSTKEDEPYFALPLNSEDNFLPLSTTFVITFTPSLCYITDLAGNRLIQTDSSYSTTKILHAKDITPPSFSVVLSPVGSNYVYAVFTKPLNLDPELVGKFKENITIEPAPSDSLSIEDVSVALNSDSCTAILFKMNRDITLSDVENLFLKINDEGTVISTPFGDLKTSYFRDSEGNGIPALTSHAISDFAINAVDVIYACAAQNEDDGWNEQGIYGSTDFDGYAVHNFSGETTNDSRLLSGHDIVFQYKFDEGESRKLALVAEKKSALKSSWISDRYNSLTGSDWRIWLDCTMDSVASDYNPSPFSNNCSPVFEKVDGSDSLWNMTWKNDDFKLAAGNEYQFFFKILDSAGNPIEIDHDGDAETAKIPLYAFRMPKEQIATGNFSFIDLWSFNISSITKQRGGVTILNNVIDAGIGEKCTVEVNLPSEGNLNIFVMTLDGNIIKRLSKGIVTAGTHYYYWDGKNNAGNPVARGLYFVRVSGSGIDETRKVMVVK